MDHVNGWNMALRQRSRATWNTYTQSSRVREVVAYVVAFICLATTFMSVRTQTMLEGTITEVKETQVTDRYGQLIGDRTDVARIPVTLTDNAFIDSIIGDTFSIINSATAMRRQYNDVLVNTGTPEIKSRLNTFWIQTSPLRPDGSFAPINAERLVKVTSIVNRGDTEAGSEFLVEFTTQDSGGGSVAPAQLWQADLILSNGGGSPSDINLRGKKITHFDWSAVR